ncbi:Morn repeat incomplete domain containing protein [Pandoravirus neocaledonia]|uniref:Morn repeat incomplete domain containing protein n=1 Tax=Pandoravirus neocaledonia TaxID=2107708 RepID=A0A2U7UCE7_9VIRU|nr:Morn repeat incomplete domain containing protein [Pandoravirus neocaledonia]AVK76103.1 Morn repeat incomplete domain containing protein [Pandoravirus neocaledonia]
MTINPDRETRFCVATLSIIMRHGYGGDKRRAVYHGRVWQPVSGRWWKPPLPHGYGVLRVGPLVEEPDACDASERVRRLLPPEDTPIDPKCNAMATSGGWNNWNEGDWADGIWDQGDFKTGTARITCSDFYRYEGPWEDGYPHGEGVFWGQGSTSTGHFERGFLQGHATKVWGDPRDGCTYTGEWDCGQRHGRGSMTYRKANDKKKKDPPTIYMVTYDGEWADDRHHGSGVATYTDGSHYNGQWKKDLRDGSGTMTEGDGSTFTGMWRKGDRHGHGVAADSDGARYEGEWGRDARSGKGKQTFADGAYYDGEWLFDTRAGQGVQVDTDGSRYEGIWVEGKRQGWGVQTYADGSSYEGEWHEDKRHGQGLQTDVDGLAYRGGWFDGKRHGFGTLRTGGGTGYMGQWKNDARDATVRSLSRLLGNPWRVSLSTIRTGTRPTLYVL